MDDFHRTVQTAFENRGKLQRCPLYIENYELQATHNKPVLYGVHRTDLFIIIYRIIYMLFILFFIAESIKLLKFLNRKLERRGNNIGLTLKFPDNQCYHFIRQKRAGVKNFVNKDGEVPFRCAKFAQKKVGFFQDIKKIFIKKKYLKFQCTAKAMCTAKASLKPRDHTKLEDVEKNWNEISDPDFWEVRNR